MAKRRHSLGREAARSLQAVATGLRGIKSPIDRAHAAQDVLAAVAEATNVLAAIKRGAIRQMYEDGWTITDIASEFEFSRARAHEIVNT
jgi:DNA-directed RNA polymerase specialized sigma24 family protein